MTKKFCESAEGLSSICDQVAEGGSLLTICEDKKISYGKVIAWIYKDADRQKSYEVALEARGEYVAQKLLRELDRVGFNDIRKLFNDDGSIKNVSELDDKTAACIAGIDIQDPIYDKEGEEVSPRTRKIKMVDKLKALEMLGKNLKMFTDKVEHSGQVTLEQLVEGSLKKEESDNGQEDQGEPQEAEAEPSDDEI